MKITFLETGFFKLDGGAMFGIVPKRLWNKLNPADDNNLCTWSMRCLLVQHQGRNILIDTGLGNKQDEKFRSHFQPFGHDNLLGSLAAQGLHPEDITDVLLTHLHFDHVGGAISSAADGALYPTFPNATYWSCDRHWQWALQPNAREAASFLRENIQPIQDMARLELLPATAHDLPWLPGIHLRFVYGHTEAMCLPIIDYGDTKLVYCADLLPSSFHLRMPYIMAYDLRPLDTLREKQQLLEEAQTNRWLLAFEHDPASSYAAPGQDELGNFRWESKQGQLETL